MTRVSLSPAAPLRAAQSAAMAAMAAMAAALAGAVLLAATVPAAAVAIKHTNRAEGDPDAALAARSATRAAPPADVTGPRYFDKSHESGNRG